MRPFNLDEAKAGKAVRTRDGRNVRIICFDAHREHFPIIALIGDGDKELVASYCADGRYYYDRDLPEHCTDLFMAPEKHEGFVWTDGKNACAYIYHSKEEALSHKVSGEYYLAKIEWEE